MSRKKYVFCTLKFLKIAKKLGNGHPDFQVEGSKRLIPVFVAIIFELANAHDGNIMLVER